MLLLALATAASAGEVAILPVFGEAPLRPEELVYANAQGQILEVTRLDFLVSDFALQRTDGSWQAASGTPAFCSLAKGQMTVAREPFEGEFQAARFLVGLRPEQNHADPAKHPAGHPLNPSVNGLHWGWAGGYVFAAIEGRWRGRGGRIHGYSFHLASDENLAEVKISFAPQKADSLAIRFDLSRVFGRMWLDPRDATTHSRPGDTLAAQLRDNLRSAFSVETAAVQSTRSTQGDRGAVIIAPDAKPYAFTFPAYFPRPALPLDNPLTEEGVELGRHLFHDPRLSGNGTQSCASCHLAERGFSETLRVSRGATGAVGTRNAMGLENLAWKAAFFWDGRASSLREQVLMPIENPLEMAARLPEVIERLSTAEDNARFAAAFGSGEVNADRLARALEQFVLTRVAANSKFDEVMRGVTKFTAEEQRGFELFHTEFDPRRGLFGADCFHCHGGPLFRNADFANNGLDFESRDRGRAGVTGRAADEAKFAVPSLRNVAVTGPYMHDGRFATLEEVIGFYDRGARPSRTLDPNLAKHPPHGLRLPPEDRRALVAFLETLTDQRPAELTAAKRGEAR